MNLENAIWLAGIFAEAAVVGLLLYRRAYKLIPVFCIFCAWELVTDLANFPIHQRFTGDTYLKVYLAETAVDSALQFCVLVELAWSVLRPIRSSLPRATHVVIVGLILAIGGAIWPFSDVSAQLSSLGHLLMHLLQTVSILRIIFFLALAACSQLLSIGWRDREMQVATGLGIYSLASLGVAMFHTHQATGAMNSQLNAVVVGSYYCSLLYWVFCFARKEAPRREFTPQMQNMLLAVAGVARADRATIARPSVTDSHNRRDR
jgi:hypothetical protein